MPRKPKPQPLPIPTKPRPSDPTFVVGVFGDFFEFHTTDYSSQLIDRNMIVGAKPHEGDTTILTVYGSPRPLLVLQPYHAVRSALSRR